MIKYNVRSKELIDMVNDIKDKKLILSPFFQRNFVWRLVHQVDFIKTILMEFPIPQIFIAKGDLDVDKMINTSCVVDGQQRMTTILQYIDNEIEVDGKYFNNLTTDEKEKILKYQIPIIDLQVKHDDLQVQEIFQRLNRTFYSLSSVEKLSNEFSTSEFMLLAKYLIKEISFDNNDEDIFLPMQKNPYLPETFINWARNHNPKNFFSLILDGKIFSSYEISRQSHLLFTLNIMATVYEDFFNRNELSTKFLDKYSNEFNDNDKDEIFNKLENIALKIIKIKFPQKSYWLNKANMFSLIVLFYKNYDFIESLDNKVVRDKLTEFENLLPEEYKIAAREGVNNKKERLIRNKYLTEILIE